MNRLPAAVVAVAAVVTLGACGGGTDAPPAASQTSPMADASTDTSTSPSSATTTAQDIGPHNSADTMFLQAMIAHHNGALDMSGPEFVSVAGPQVKALANRISTAQEPEIRRMTGWLEGWGESADMGGMDMSSMPGMQMNGKSQQDVMDELSNLSGKQFDEAWLRNMISHHEGAVSMSKDVIAKGRNPEVKALAENILKSQSAEITEMRRMLG